MNKKLVSIAVTTSLGIGGSYVHAGDAVALAPQAIDERASDVNLARLASENELFVVEETVDVSDAQIVIRAKRQLDISILLPDLADMRSMDSAAFITFFDGKRQAYFPNEEIQLEVHNNRQPSVTAQPVEKAISGYLVVGSKYGWNTTLYNGQKWVYGPFSNSNGIAAFTNVRTGTVAQWLLRSNVWSAQTNVAAGVRWAGAGAGSNNWFGTQSQCITSSCNADFVAYYYW